MTKAKAVQQEPRAGSARGCRVGRRRPVRVFAGGFAPAALGSRTCALTRVRLSTHCRAVALAASGAGDAGSPVAVWLALNEVSFGWCDWWVFEVVVEGAAGDVFGEGRVGLFRGVLLDV